MVKKTKFITIIFLIIVFPLFSAYFSGKPLTVLQPDGSELNCYASGDEFYNWLHDKVGYTIIKNNSGYYSYARMVDGEITGTELIPGRIDPIEAGLTPEINLSPEEISAIRNERYDFWEEPVLDRAPTTGELNNLVVFIRFSDQSEFTEQISGYDSAFNAPTGVSMKNYYTEVSSGQLDISTTIYPSPTGSTVLSYQDSHPRSYFEVYDAATNPDGYQNNNQRTQREHQLLVDAVNFISSQVPAELELDNDGDGRVDNVCFIIKGSPEGWAELLWPHMWSLYSQSAYINGSRVYTYNFQLSNWFEVYVLCHEMFHSLGAPDLYRYYDTSITPVGAWDLMASNTNPPQHMSAYMKYKYGNWFSSLPEITSDGLYTLDPLSQDPYACYKIPSPNSTDEFFVVEYRKDEGTFESGLSTSGLLVSRIDPDVSGNANGPPDEVYLYRPNGTLTNNGTISQANYAANFGRTEINDTTNPSSFLSDGSPGGLNISAIGYLDNTISFFVGEVTPGIEVSPGALTKTMDPGLTAIDTLLISNNGDPTSELSYNITVSPDDWLSATPINGNLPAGENVEIEIEFNTTGLSPGNYSADITISNNAEGPVVIPVSLTVNQLILDLSGTVSLNDSPLADAVIYGTNTDPDSIVTGSDGTYSFTANYNAPVTLTAYKQYYDFTPENYATNIISDTIVDFTATEWAPEPPENGAPTGNDVPIDVAQLTWTAPAGEVETNYYNVLLSINPDYSDPLINDSTTDLFYPLASLQIEYQTQYFVSVTAHFEIPGRGGSTPLEWSFTTEELLLPISGIITFDGEPLSDVEITGINTQPIQTYTDLNGEYNFSAVYNSIISLTPQKTGYDFAPVQFQTTVTDTIIANFTATEWSPDQPQNGLPQGDDVPVAVVELSWDEPGGSVPVNYYEAIFSQNEDLSDAIINTTTDNSFYSLAGIELQYLQEYFVSITAIYSPLDRGPSPPLLWSFVIEHEPVIVEGVTTFNGDPLAGVTITGSGTFQAEIITDEAGTFFLTAPYQQNITIIPEKEGFDFDPVEYSATATDSIFINFIADEWDPNSPTNGSPTGINIPTTLEQLSWTEPTGNVPVTAYHVILSENENYSDPLIDTETTNTFYSLNEFELENGLTYSVSVTANYTVPARGDSPPLEWSFTTLPANVQISGFVLRGLSPVSNVAMNDSVFTDPDGFYTFNIPCNSAAFLEPVLVNYTFSPAYVDLENVQEDTQIDFQAIKHPPATPELTGFNIEGNNIDLTWEPVPGAIRYRIYSSDNPLGNYTIEATVYETSWSGTRSDGKRFYKITAVN